jgi:hypothetical protein
MPVGRVLAVLGFALLVAGCGTTSAPVAQGSPAPSATGAAKGAMSFQVSTDSGQVSLSLDGQLPPNWPSDFPVPSGATPAGSGSLTGSSSGVMVGVYQTTATPADTFAFYQSPSSGLTTSGAKSVGVGSSYVGRLKMSAPHNGSVTVVSHNSTTFIVIVITS